MLYGYDEHGLSWHMAQFGDQEGNGKNRERNGQGKGKGENERKMILLYYAVR